MSAVNGYLTKLSNQLLIPEPEKEKIEISISRLKEKIWGQFQDKLLALEVFGSYERGTKLSKSIDEKSDVDVLVTFKSQDYQPQTYLNCLKDFAEKNYPRSEVAPDHPVIIIEMDHMKFELVPSFKNGSQLKIPAPRVKETKWISTDPLAFKREVINKDINNYGLILPTIRIVKYWNTQIGKPFLSYYLEKFIVEHSYAFCKNLKDYFFEVINDLSNEGFEKDLKLHVKGLHEKRRRILLMEDGDISDYIEQELISFIPLI